MTMSTAIASLFRVAGRNSQRERSSMAREARAVPAPESGTMEEIFPSRLTAAARVIREAEPGAFPAGGSAWIPLRMGTGARMATVRTPGGAGSANQMIQSEA